jgi:hypothetical protein
MRKATFAGMMIGVSLIIALSGCGQKKHDPGPDSSTKTPAAGQGTVQPNPNTAPAEQTAKIKVYHGDENAEKLVESEDSITYSQASDKYKAALQALTVSSDAKLIPLAKGIAFRTAVLDKGILNVDVTISPAGRLGAPGEEMLLQSISRTVFQFAEVTGIEITVDGKRVESLMGHVDLEHPMKRK